MEDLEEYVDANGIALLVLRRSARVGDLRLRRVPQRHPEAWEDVRSHPRLKEEVFDPLLSRHGDRRQPGAGRGLMISESLKNLPLLFQLCPELRCLRGRIAMHLGGD